MIWFYKNWTILFGQIFKLLCFFHYSISKIKLINNILFVISLYMARFGSLGALFIKRNSFHGFKLRVRNITIRHIHTKVMIVISSSCHLRWFPTFYKLINNVLFIWLVTFFSCIWFCIYKLVNIVSYSCLYLWTSNGYLKQCPIQFWFQIYTIPWFATITQSYIGIFHIHKMQLLATLIQLHLFDYHCLMAGMFR
jgi:hypothetical protein